jgi:hypothetical protein
MFSTSTCQHPTPVEVRQHILKFLLCRRERQDNDRRALRKKRQPNHPSTSRRSKAPSFLFLQQQLPWLLNPPRFIDCACRGTTPISHHESTHYSECGRTSTRSNGLDARARSGKLGPEVDPLAAVPTFPVQRPTAAQLPGGIKHAVHNRVPNQRIRRTCNHDGLGLQMQDYRILTPTRGVAWAPRWTVTSGCST